MAGFTNGYSATVLGLALVDGDYIGYSANGTSEASAVMTRTKMNADNASGAWSTAVAGAPSTKANAQALTSPDAIGPGTLSHSAVFSAVSGGTQKTDWEELLDPNTGDPLPRAVVAGDNITHAVGEVVVTLD